MRFRRSRRGRKRQRQSPVNRIDLPDFIPLEFIEPTHSHPHNHNQNYQHQPSFQDSRMNDYHQKQNIIKLTAERQYPNRRETSDSNERQKRNHSPITHHPSKYRSKSPNNIKVIARVGHRAKQAANFSEFEQEGNHYEDVRIRRSPIIFDLNDQRQRHSTNESNDYPPEQNNPQYAAPEFNNNRNNPSILVTLDDRPEYREIRPKIEHEHEENEILMRLENLERDKKQLLGHCTGLRDTIDQYYREISKLEALIHTYSQEIEIIKRRVYK